MKLLITGDFCPQNRILDKILSNQDGDIFNDINHHIKKADLCITNLETAIIRPEDKAVSKVGKNLGASSVVLSFLKERGFELVTLANNHFMDYGTSSANYALDQISENELAYVGAVRDDLEIQKAFIYDKDNVKIGIRIISGKIQNSRICYNKF